MSKGYRFFCSRGNWEQPSKFIQRPWIKKKRISEDERRRREWREFKGIYRDHAKDENPWSNGPCKNYELNAGHRRRRRWEKRRLKAGDYSLERGYKSFIDPWDWH